MAYIHSTWLAGSAKHARTNIGNHVVTVHLPDGITLGSPEGDHADEFGRTLVAMGEQVLVLNGTRRNDQDDLAVRLFAEQEGIDPELLPTLRRLVAYVDSVRANPLNDLVVTELAEVDQ